MPTAITDVHLWMYNVPLASNVLPLQAQRRAARDGHVENAKQCTVGPMPAQEFLDSFLPPIPPSRKKDILSSKNAFKDVPSSSANPADIRDALVAALNEFTNSRSRAPGLAFETATERPAETYICCYATPNIEHVHRAPPSARAAFGYTELLIEVKSKVALDVFSDPPPNATPENRASHDFFTVFTNKRVERRALTEFGKLIVCTTEIQARQHRTCLFSISISGSRARLLRLDRSGIIVSEAFDIRARPELLCEFLARFACASRAQRGHDGTVQMSHPGEEETFWDTVTKYLQEQLGLSGADLKKAVKEHYQPGCVAAMQVFVQGTEDAAVSAIDRYLVSRPIESPVFLHGRATRRYWAVHASTRQLVLLKDTWRGWEEQEGTVISRLNALEVRNVPPFVAHGDVFENAVPRKRARSGSATRIDQHTKTDQYDAKPWVCPVDGKRANIPTSVHYRLVLGTVGNGLEQFKGTHELLHSTYDVFQAMRNAAGKDSRIHRNISVGSILLVNEPGSDTRKGYLIDWDMSSRVDAEGQSLTAGRTGTWKYMSDKLLANLPDEPHALTDDMESLLYVVLYCGLRHLSRDSSPEALATRLRYVFDYFMGPRDKMIGGLFKLRDNRERVTGDVHFRDPGLRRWLDGVTELLDRRAPGGRWFDPAPEWKDPEGLDAVWRTVLADCELARDDRVDDNLSKPASYGDTPDTFSPFVHSALTGKRPAQVEPGVEHNDQGRRAKRARIDITASTSTSAVRRSARRRRDNASDRSAYAQSA